ncbi:MAG: MarR family winged helix-turn-helix transcriptional regulator [Gammaproteobacteria bacterium]
MQTSLTIEKNDLAESSTCLDFNATTVLLGLSIVNNAKQQLKEPLSTAKLTMSQWLVLKILYLNRAATPTNVAKTIDADPTTISRHLDSLEARGLIERKHDTDDRRVIQLQITPEGILVAKQIYARYSGILQNLESCLTGEQLLIWKKVSEYAGDHMSATTTA